MALEKLVSEAKRWADESALGFTVSGVTEGTRKISFRAPCGSFYVTVPENVGSEEWVRVLTYICLTSLVQPTTTRIARLLSVSGTF